MGDSWRIHGGFMDNFTIVDNLYNQHNCRIIVCCGLLMQLHESLTGSKIRVRAHIYANIFEKSWASLAFLHSLTTSSIVRISVSN